ncbi:MAG TPA: hypothetical protein VJL59_08865 [Anaerolineales bacterium]|nr:hypothetical protein [Anaerolineales bacterium]HLB47126.1 hypothetical protein [Anaerolineales bacterium]
MFKLDHPRAVTPQIHPTAEVSPTAQLGQGVVVGPGAIIYDNVVVGDHTFVGARAPQWPALANELGLADSVRFVGPASCCDTDGGREGYCVRRGNRAAVPAARALRFRRIDSDSVSRSGSGTAHGRGRACVGDATV